MKFRSHLSLSAPLSSRDCRDGQLEKSIADPSSGPMKCAENDEMKALVQQAFATLPQEQRTVVVLKEYHALKFSEIAEIMNCPIGTVKSLNHRGRQKLMESLSKYMG